MAKKVVKEVIIALLLCLVILLVLGILLYEYVPMTKTLPNEVAYTTPEKVKEELANSSNIDESQIIMTYEVDATDLNNYEKIQGYKPGKANPFSSYGATQTTGTNTTTANSSAGGNSNGSDTDNIENNTTSNNGSSQTNTAEENTTTSGGQFFQDKGTK